MVRASSRRRRRGFGRLGRWWRYRARGSRDSSKAARGDVEGGGLAGPATPTTTSTARPRCSRRRRRGRVAGGHRAPMSHSLALIASVDGVGVDGAAGGGRRAGRRRRRRLRSAARTEASDPGPVRGRRAGRPAAWPRGGRGRVDGPGRVGRGRGRRAAGRGRRMSRRGRTPCRRPTARRGEDPVDQVGDARRSVSGAESVVGRAAAAWMLSRTWPGASPRPASSACQRSMQFFEPGVVVVLVGAGSPGRRRRPEPGSESYPGLGEVVVDVVGALREHLGDGLGDPGDAPVVEPPGRAVDRARWRSPARPPRPPHATRPTIGGGVDHVAQPGGVEGLPAAAGRRASPSRSRPARGRAGSGRRPGTWRGGCALDQPRWSASAPGAAAAAALSGEPGVEEREGGIGLGVEDRVHVIGPADHAQHGDGLVRGDHELETRALRGDEPCPQHRVTGAALGEHRPVVLVGDRAGEAQPRCPSAAPAPAGVSPREP